MRSQRAAVNASHDATPTKPTGTVKASAPLAPRLLKRISIQLLERIVSVSDWLCLVEKPVADVRGSVGNFCPRFMFKRLHFQTATALSIELSSVSRKARFSVAFWRGSVGVSLKFTLSFGQ
jgi:hypothetical protein